MLLGLDDEKAQGFYAKDLMNIGEPPEKWTVSVRCSC